MQRSGKPSAPFAGLPWVAGRNLGCLDTDCNLCKENPHRRCDGNFSNKYLAGDVLKAKCGAAIRIELLNRATAESVPMIDGMEDIRLEVPLCLLMWLRPSSGHDGQGSSVDDVELLSLEQSRGQHCHHAAPVDYCPASANIGGLCPWPSIAASHRGCLIGSQAT